MKDKQNIQNFRDFNESVNKQNINDSIENVIREISLDFNCSSEEINMGCCEDFAYRVKKKIPSVKILSTYESQSYKKWKIYVTLKSYTTDSLIELFDEFGVKKGKQSLNENKSDVINFEGNQYIISDEDIKDGDLYINYSNYNRGIADKNLKYIIGTVMEIGSDGADIVIYAKEMKSDLLSSCKKLVLKP
jgi:hypothetical protein